MTVKDDGEEVTIEEDNPGDAVPFHVVPERAAQPGCLVRQTHNVCLRAGIVVRGGSMNVFRKAIALSTVALVLSGGMMFAQENHGNDPHAQHDNHVYVEHKEWHKGVRMNRDDWARGERVDYRTYHLNAPPRGYEWRQVDGNYVLGAVATGLIASVIVASTVH